MVYGLFWSAVPLVRPQVTAPPSITSARSSTPTAESFFDVISIHPVDLSKDTSAYGVVYKPGLLHGFQVSPQMLIWAATGTNDVERIKGMPDWATHAKYNIDAKVVEGNISPAIPVNDEKAMLLSILTSRFHFSSHYESALIPVFALVVTKKGVQHMSIQRPADAPTPSTDSCIWRRSQPGYIKAEACSMVDLSAKLNIVDDRQVVDRTGLIDRYYFELHFNNKATSALINGYRFPATPDDHAEWPSLYAALPQQLGLQFKPIKAQMPILVIDHIEPPSEN